jgi:hypothetical protein
MSLLDKITAIWSTPAPVTPVREAWGRTIDDDEQDWRPLTGDSARDLPVLTQSRMREIAAWLWQTNLLANRLIELPVAYLLAEGVALRAKDPESQKVLDAFWGDPINQWDLKLPRKVRELALYGEQCWPAFVDSVTGHVRLGYLDPARIQTVVTDPDNADQPIGIVTAKDKQGRARRYRIIINGPEDCFSPRTVAIRRDFADGECFYFTINALSNGRRGRSDLLAQADWLDAYEQFLFGEIDRNNFLRAFLWDVTLKGATPAEVEARAKQIAAPAPGSVRVHNDAETWETVTPDLKAVDAAEAARLFRNHILGGATMPEHWSGGGGDVNRATGESMSEPTFKMYSMRQREWKNILEQVARFVINRNYDPSGAELLIDILDPDPEFVPEAVFPEMTTRDTTKYASALQQVVAACALAVEREFLSAHVAAQIIQTVAERLGVEYDAEQALQEAQAAAALRQADDVFTDPPTEPTGA